MNHPSLVVVNLDYCLPGTVENLQKMGIDYILVEGMDVPAVQTVPTKEDRRFTAAVAALQGVISNPLTGTGRAEEPETVAKSAVAYADALLAELVK